MLCWMKDSCAISSACAFCRTILRTSPSSLPPPPPTFWEHSPHTLVLAALWHFPMTQKALVESETSRGWHLEICCRQTWSAWWFPCGRVFWSCRIHQGTCSPELPFCPGSPNKPQPAQLPQVQVQHQEAQIFLGPLQPEILWDSQTHWDIA